MPDSGGNRPAARFVGDEVAGNADAGEVAHVSMEDQPTLRPAPAAIACICAIELELRMRGAMAFETNGT